MAHADTIGITTHDVHAAPGGTASVVFDFDFGASPGLTSFEIHLNYDKSLLSLTQSAATYNGGAVDPASVFGTDYSANASDPLGFSAIWLPFSDPNAVVSLAGTAEWVLTYMLLPGFAAPSGTPIGLDFSYSDINADPGLVNGFATPFVVTSTLRVDASSNVPEPATGTLLLGGLTLIGLRARRRVVHTRA